MTGEKRWVERQYWRNHIDLSASFNAIVGKVCGLAENWNFADTDHVLSSYKFNLLTIVILHLEARRWSCLKTEKFGSL